ncbi:DUF4430 domain-containing protein [Streptomyces roseirectus]|uniref:DUF4430 domain-containing protein n=1 Tax=Streptomyces roseirectus TaxID=2768066 RepID=A0A7H0IBP6_9ACTN|nr:DUF4430 domain-containing protein [Streptomyces roseirectus]QNP70212.1 DUF4430 domain-containing protein [Streptomyces roseirectus]
MRRTAITTTVLTLALFAAPVTAQANTEWPSAARTDTNAPVKVKLTVRGPDGTLFKGKVKTKGHDVTPATGGTHTCDGTNAGANPSPVPTPTAALDDAAKLNGFTWDGTWYPSFDDYLVESVKGVPASTTAYWSISVNGVQTPVGGCQFKLNAGDSVAFTWTAL